MTFVINNSIKSVEQKVYAKGGFTTFDLNNFTFYKVVYFAEEG